MGSDKALLEFGSETLLQRALRTMSAAADEVIIVGSREKYASYGEVVEDIHRGVGPLGGIHAALSATRTELNLILAVDIPFVNVELLRWILAQAQASDDWIVIPDVAGGPQPLCGMYHRKVVSFAEEALARGEYKIAQLFAHVPTRYLGEAEIREAGFAPEMFLNVNNPEDYRFTLTIEDMSPRNDRHD